MASEEEFSRCAAWSVYDLYRWRLDTFHYLPGIDSSYRAWLCANNIFSLDSRPYGPYWRFRVSRHMKCHLTLILP